MSVFCSSIGFLNRFDLDTSSTAQCLKKIESQTTQSGIGSFFCARLYAAEASIYALVDFSRHIYHFISNAPQAFANGSLSRHSWHLVRAANHLTYSLFFPLALTPTLSLRAAEALQLRQPWESSIRVTCMKVQSTLLRLAKNRRVRSIVKISAGILAFTTILKIFHTSKDALQQKRPPVWSVLQEGKKLFHIGKQHIDRVAEIYTPTLNTFFKETEYLSAVQFKPDAVAAFGYVAALTIPSIIFFECVDFFRKASTKSLKKIAAIGDTKGARTDHTVKQNRVEKIVPELSSEEMPAMVLYRGEPCPVLNKTFLFSGEEYCLGETVPSKISYHEDLCDIKDFEQQGGFFSDKGDFFVREEPVEDVVQSNLTTTMGGNSYFLYVSSSGKRYIHIEEGWHLNCSQMISVEGRYVNVKDIVNNSCAQRSSICLSNTGSVYRVNRNHKG